MSWFVYILQSEKDGDYYKGITENIELRLKQHNAGQSTYTHAVRHVRLSGMSNDR